MTKQRKAHDLVISFSVYMPARMACYFCGGLVVDAKVTGAICDPCLKVQLEKPVAR